MDKPQTYSEAPEEIREAVERLIKTYGSDQALLAGAIVSATCRTIMAAKAEEREACASICDIAAEHCLQERNQHPLLSKLRVSNHGAMTLAEDLAEVIRKRGEVNTAHKISEIED